MDRTGHDRLVCEWYLGHLAMLFLDACDGGDYGDNGEKSICSLISCPRGSMETGDGGLKLTLRCLNKSSSPDLGIGMPNTPR